MPSILDHALDLARRGFRVFPIEPNGNRPFFKGWQAAATWDEETLTRWWTENPNCNVGVATGAWRGEGHLVVLDADVKKNKPGLVSLTMLETLEGLPTTFGVQTPSTGVHRYLLMPDDTGITISADRMPDYPAIDVRGQGGYVVGPGSVINGRSYTVTEPADVAQSPAGIVTLARSAQGRQREVKDREAVVELDTIDAVMRATEWLRNSAPEAIEGAGGDDTTFKVAAKLRDFGLSKGTAFLCLSIHWNEAGKASPPWMPEDLQKKVDNAFSYGSYVHGGALAIAEFDAVPDEQRNRWEVGVKGRTSKLFAIDFETSAGRALEEDVQPLIEGLLDTEAMSVLYGESNSGKTFVALDMGFHIAAAMPWQGRPVASGLVVHLVLEGGRGFHQRVAATRQRYAAELADRRVPFVIVPCPIDMRTSAIDTRAAIKLVEQIATDFGVPVRLVVIDTLSRALAGGEENGSQDMGAFVTYADAFRADLSCHVMVVHHSGKDTAKGARGHSLLRAATDTEIEIAENEIRVRKQRDMDRIDAIKFALDTVELGTTASGRRRTSCVVSLVTGSEFETVELSKAAEVMWEAYQDAAKDKAQMTCGAPEKWRTQIVSSEHWEASYRKARADGSETEKEVSARWVRGLRKEVVDSGRVRKVTENQWVAPVEVVRK